MSETPATDYIQAMISALSGLPKPRVLRFGATKLMPGEMAISIERDDAIYVMASRLFWAKLDTRHLAGILSDLTKSAFSGPFLGTPIFDLDSSPDLMEEFCKACLGGVTL